MPVSTLQGSCYRRTQANFAADADPNTVLPNQPSLNSNVPFETQDNFHPGGSAGLVLAMARSAAGDSSVTVSIWVFDQSFNFGANTTGGNWVQFINGLVITEKTAQVVSVLRGPYRLVYIQMTANSGTNPVALMGFWMPTP